MAMLFLGIAAVIAGDFDHDGRSDRAYVRALPNGSELVVERATRELIVVDRIADAKNFYFQKIQPGEYRTACDKELGRATKSCAVPVISVRGDALQFGTREASQAVAVWNHGRFSVHWLSD